MAGIVYTPWRIRETLPLSNYTPDRKTSWLYGYAYDRIEGLLLSNGFLQTGVEHTWKDPIREFDINIGSSNGGREWSITMTTLQGETYYVSNDPSPLLVILDKPLKFLDIR
jgi:hypothetical protein